MSKDYANLLISLNKNSTCDSVKAEIVVFQGKLSRDEAILVPYNHPMLKLNHTQMVCLGKKVNEVRKAHYHLVGQEAVTKKQLTYTRKLFGCKQLCTLVT